MTFSSFVVHDRKSTVHSSGVFKVLAELDVNKSKQNKNHSTDSQDKSTFPSEHLLRLQSFIHRDLSIIGGTPNFQFIRPRSTSVKNASKICPFELWTKENTAQNNDHRAGTQSVAREIYQEENEYTERDDTHWIIRQLPLVLNSFTNIFIPT